jgi:hypothetical protein
MYRGERGLLGAPQQLVRALEAAHRVRLVGGDRDHHRGDPVAERALLVLGPDRDRHHRHERLVGKLVALDQELPHGAGADRHDHVVHLHACLVLDRLDGVERDRAEREAAVGGDRAVEARTRRARGRDLENAGVLRPAQCPAGARQRA